MNTNAIFRLLGRGLVKNQIDITLELGLRIITVQRIQNGGLGDIVHLPCITFDEQLQNGHTYFTTTTVQFPIMPLLSTAVKDLLSIELVSISLIRYFPTVNYLPPYHASVIVSMPFSVCDPVKISNATFHELLLTTSITFVFAFPFN